MHIEISLQKHFKKRIKRTGSLRAASAEERLETDCSLTRQKNFNKKGLDIFGAGIVDLTRLENKFSMYNEDLPKKQSIMLSFLRDIEPKIIKLAEFFFRDDIKKDAHEVSAYTISDLVLELEDIAPYDEEMAKLNIDKLGFGDQFSEVLNYLFTIKDPSTKTTLIENENIDKVSEFLDF